VQVHEQAVRFSDLKLYPGNVYAAAPTNVTAECRKQKSKKMVFNHPVQNGNCSGH